MLPTLLYIKFDESNTAKQNIFISWLFYSSKAPSPSVSTTNNVLPDEVFNGFAHIHNPFVQGLTVGPTLNAEFLLMMTLFNR